MHLIYANLSCHASSGLPGEKLNQEQIWQKLVTWTMYLHPEDHRRANASRPIFLWARDKLHDGTKPFIGIISSFFFKWKIHAFGPLGSFSKYPINELFNFKQGVPSVALNSTGPAQRCYNSHMLKEKAWFRDLHMFAVCFATAGLKNNYFCRGTAVDLHAWIQCKERIYMESILRNSHTNVIPMKHLELNNLDITG